MTQSTIWKYPVEVADSIVVQMPTGARLLCVQMQHGKPCIWALCNPDAVPYFRRFRWIGTGHPIKNAENLTYIGTVQLHGGDLIFHLFEEK